MKTSIILHLYVCLFKYFFTFSVPLMFKSKPIYTGFMIKYSALLDVIFCDFVSYQYMSIFLPFLCKVYFGHVFNLLIRLPKLFSVFHIFNKRCLCFITLVSAIVFDLSQKKLTSILISFLVLNILFCLARFALNIFIAGVYLVV